MIYSPDDAHDMIAGGIAPIDLARSRIYDDEDLRPYLLTLLDGGGYGVGDEHYYWLATESTQEILNWLSELRVECAYCTCPLPVQPDDDEPPAAADDAAWDALAEDHRPECEWILTRAHRRTGGEI